MLRAQIPQILVGGGEINFKYLLDKMYFIITKFGDKS